MNRRNHRRALRRAQLPIACCLALAGGGALAQSSVTLYGRIDASVRHETNVDKSGGSVTSLESGLSTNNRWGMRGVEDLGGGLRASFVLEAGFNGDDGTGPSDGRGFGRTSTVGISGPWGALDFGRQYTVAFKTIGLYEPLRYTFTGVFPTSSTATAGARLDNSVQYTGVFGGLTVRGEYGFGEQIDSLSRGSMVAVGASYKAGPFGVGGAVTRRKSKDGLTTKFATLGGVYEAGDWRVTLGGETNLAEGLLFDTRNRSVFGGVNYKITPLLSLSVAYYKLRRSGNAKVEGSRDLALVNLTYQLSKRTSIYAEADHGRQRGALMTARPSKSGYAVGIAHFF